MLLEFYDVANSLWRPLAAREAFCSFERHGALLQNIYKKGGVKLSIKKTVAASFEKMVDDAKNLENSGAKNLDEEIVHVDLTRPFDEDEVSQKNTEKEETESDEGEEEESDDGEENDDESSQADSVDYDNLLYGVFDRVPAPSGGLW
uniref:Uncharacterized protein n=1 Tax=Romanomermis culicivorax TaxID=13658 RepID=A0A915JEZ3_ROMCU